MSFGKHLVTGVSFVALAATGAAVAQEDGTLRQQTVTVTGSAIAGTPEDAALPVDVVTAQDLRLEGSPTITELIRNLGVSSGVDGQTNQFGSNGLEGTANINLRGLGAARTLVLINGRRQTFNPNAIGEQAALFVDTNNIPAAAVGRIEVLKDGAAAVYGSDAIAGVVNFITRTDLDGLELSGTFSQFDGSDGEYEVSAAYGFQGDDWNWTTSVGYQFRNEVALLEKDWAILPFDDNPVGGWSTIGNPGSFVAIPNTTPGSAVFGSPLAFAEPDAACESLGGVDAGAVCRFQFTQFDNLVEEEERYQIFSEYNRSTGFGDLHIEALYASTEVPEWKTSPSYPPQSLFGQVIAPDHPGLVQFIADNPDWATATYSDYTAFDGTNPGDVVPGGLDTATTQLIFFGRSFGFGGFPGTGGAQEGSREYETWRLAGDLTGEFENGVTYDFGVGYSTTEAIVSTNDTYTAGFAAALQGFGVCVDPVTGLDPATGTSPLDGSYAGSLAAGVGDCEYYNPFSNAIASNAVTGEANPGFVDGLENSVTLANWLTAPLITEDTTSLLTFDGVFSGSSNVQAQGGAVSWAAGFQMRRETFETDPNDNADITVLPGAGGTGPFSFLAGTVPADEDQTIYAVFGELQVPLYDNLDVQVAMRYEDYGGDVGSTLDPKIAAKWQVTDDFALRGSAQTSFRGPTLNQLGGVGTTLQFVSPTGAFKAVDTFGNPDLDPESAFSYNFGALYQNDSFTGSIDYYYFDFSDPIIVEEQSSIVDGVVCALGGDPNSGFCKGLTPEEAEPLIARVTFQDPMNPVATGIERIAVNIVNGPDIETSGIDLRAENVFDLNDMGDFTIGGEATYVIEYDVGTYFVEGVGLSVGDVVGQFNRSNFTRSLPQLQANAFANWAMGNHNARAVVRYIDSYDDERGVATAASAPNTFQPSLGIPEIDSQTTFDLFYNYTSEDWGLDFGLGVVNVTDEDPPYAQFDLSYDPYTHNPFGRTFRVSLTKRFSGLGG